MTGTVTMTRTRVRLEQHEVAAIATALVTGSPAAVNYSWSCQASHFASLVNDQWVATSYVPFPALQPTDNAAAALHILGTFISGTGPFYAEFFTFDQDETLHANACVWDKDPERATFGFSSTVRADGVYTTTRGGGFNKTSRPRSHMPTAEALNYFIFDDAAALPGVPPADPSLLLRTCDVVTSRGIALDDPAWHQEIPAPGEDLTFESIFPSGVRGRYELTRRWDLA